MDNNQIMSCQEEYISRIKHELLGFFTTDQVCRIVESLLLVCSDYRIEKHSTSIVSYQPECISEAQFVVQNFLVAKSVEGFSPRSIAYYHQILKQFFASTTTQFPNQSLKCISSDVVRWYLAMRSVLGKVSKVTLNNERRVLSSFFSWASSEGYVQVNPMLKIKSIRVDKRVKEPFTDDDMEAIRGSVRNNFEHALVELLYSTGIRCSELVQIRIRDIDFQNMQMKVLGKGGKERFVYLNAKAKRAVLAHMSHGHVDCYLFPASRSSNHISTSYVRQVLHDIGKRAGVSDVHPHRFRRTTASMALSRGMPIDQVQKLLGHSNIETTTLYAITDVENVKSSHKKYLN